MVVGVRRAVILRGGRLPDPGRGGGSGAVGGGLVVVPGEGHHAMLLAADSPSPRIRSLLPAPATTAGVLAKSAYGRR